LLKYKKMKSLLILLSTISPALCACQNLTYTEVVSADSSSKDLLYSNAKEWFVHAFNSANNVIQYDSKDEGKLIGKGNFTFHGKAFTSGTSSTGPVTFTITIEVKDNKYKYTLTDFDHESFGLVPQTEPKGMMKVANRDLWKDCNKEATAMIADLKKAMIKTKSNF